LRRVVPEALAALKASPGFKRAAGALPLVRPAYALIGGRRRPAAAPASAVPPAVPDRPIQLIPDMMIDYYACTTDYRIDRARDHLGYAPAYDLASGMALTESWARWANLIPS
jgi:nucleoside-diphosphate-sugar epimerase